MSQLHFPFWMARLADNGVTATNGLQPFAYSSPKRLAAYLTAQNSQHWQLHLVTRYSAVTYLTELNLLGHSKIHEDGTDGDGLPINQLLESLSDS